MCYCLFWVCFKSNLSSSLCVIPSHCCVPEAKGEEELVVKWRQQKLLLKHLCPFGPSVSVVQRSLLLSKVSSLGALALCALSYFYQLFIQILMWGQSRQCRELCISNQACPAWISNPAGTGCFPWSKTCIPFSISTFGSRNLCWKTAACTSCFWVLDRAIVFCDHLSSCPGNCFVVLIHFVLPLIFIKYPFVLSSFSCLVICEPFPLTQFNC